MLEVMNDAVVGTLTEANDPYCLSQEQADALLAGAQWRRFAVIGDSLSAGTGDSCPGYANGPWGDRVFAALKRRHPETTYLNTGVIGATTQQVLSQQTQRMLDLEPDLVHVLCGANDIWQRDVSWNHVEQTLRELFALASGTGADMTTFTLGNRFLVPSIPDFQDRVRRLNDITRSLADTFGVVVVEMWDHPIMSRENLLSADQVHLSASGQAVMAAEVIRALAGVLAAHR